MSTRNLEYLFRPGSIAVIGAADRFENVGATVIRNPMRSNFAGPVMPVNPNCRSVAGVLCYPRVAELPAVPMLPAVVRNY